MSHLCHRHPTTKTELSENLEYIHKLRNYLGQPFANEKYSCGQLVLKLRRGIIMSLTRGAGVRIKHRRRYNRNLRRLH